MAQLTFTTLSIDLSFLYSFTVAWGLLKTPRSVVWPVHLSFIDGKNASFLMIHIQLHWQLMSFSCDSNFIGVDLSFCELLIIIITCIYKWFNYTHTHT